MNSLILRNFFAIILQLASDTWQSSWQGRELYVLFADLALCIPLHRCPALSCYSLTLLLFSLDIVELGSSFFLCLSRGGSKLLRTLQKSRTQKDAYEKNYSM